VIKEDQVAQPPDSNARKHFPPLGFEWLPVVLDLGVVKKRSGPGEELIARFVKLVVGVEFPERCSGGGPEGGWS